MLKKTKVYMKVKLVLVGNEVVDKDIIEIDAEVENEVMMLSYVSLLFSKCIGTSMQWRI